MSTQCNWQDHSDIERWVDEWRFAVRNKTYGFDCKDDPIDEIRHRLSRGDFNGKNKTSVEAFLAEHDANARRVSDHGKADREERAIIAAERSADASDRSAKWAGWAIAISLVSLALAAWSLMK